MKLTRKNGKIIIILATAAIFAAVCGLWLLTSPSRERGKVEAAQDALIEDLMRDINGAEDITEPETERVVDITITEGISFAEDYNGCETDNADYEALYIPEYTPAVYDHDPEPTITPAYYPPVIADPVPDNAFPNNIVGIGILTIDSINLRLPIAEGIEYASLRIAPGRVPQTAQVGGIGNAVIAGHRNYAYGSMFNRLDEVGIGEIIQYQARNGELMEFEVFEIAVIEPQDQIAFIQPVNESIVTLYTCTPIRTATHRLIIRAQRIS